MAKAAFLIYCILALALTANSQSNSKLLCERIANHCKAACATYWDECHMEMDFSNVIGSGVRPSTSRQTTATTTTTSRIPDIISPTSDYTIYPVLSPNHLRPATTDGTSQCAQYRDPCGMGRLCCKGYSCRYRDVTTGTGYCF